jgi:carbonic anhydrase/acetyltransferase-like protein (isoleucine patch superfamily)
MIFSNLLVTAQVTCWIGAKTRRRAAKREIQINITSNIQSVVVIVAFCSIFFFPSP